MWISVHTWRNTSFTSDVRDVSFIAIYKAGCSYVKPRTDLFQRSLPSDLAPKPDQEPKPGSPPMLVTVRKSSYVKYYCFFFLCIFSSHCCLFYMFIGRRKVQSSSAVCDLTARSLLNLLAGLQAEVVGGFLSNCTFGIIFNFWPQFFFFPLLTFFLLGSIFFFFFLSNAAVNFFMLIIQLFMPLSLVAPSIWKMNGTSTEGVKSSPKISCKNN